MKKQEAMKVVATETSIEAAELTLRHPGQLGQILAMHRWIRRYHETRAIAAHIPTKEVVAVVGPYRE
jgi:hypothetical protein